jgi:hypothetical protein
MKKPRKSSVKRRTVKKARPHPDPGEIAQVSTVTVKPTPEAAVDTGSFKRALGKLGKAIKGKFRR